MLDLLDVLLTAGFWAATIRIACPLILGTIGELIASKGGDVDVLLAELNAELNQNRK